MSRQEKLKPAAVMGRPRSEKDMRTIIAAGHIGCTNEEAAALCKVSRATFVRWLEDPETRAAWEEAHEHMKTSLRRHLFRHAEKNVAAAIFLAKNLLGMRDNPPDHEVRDAMALVKAFLEGQSAAPGGE